MTTLGHLRIIQSAFGIKRSVSRQFEKYCASNADSSLRESFLQLLQERLVIEYAEMGEHFYQDDDRAWSDEEQDLANGLETGLTHGSCFECDAVFSFANRKYECSQCCHFFCSKHKKDVLVTTAAGATAADKAQLPTQKSMSLCQLCQKTMRINQRTATPLSYAPPTLLQIEKKEFDSASQRFVKHTEIGRVTVCAIFLCCRIAILPPAVRCVDVIETIGLQVSAGSHHALAFRVAPGESLQWSFQVATGSHCSMHSMVPPMYRQPL